MTLQDVEELKKILTQVEDSELAVHFIILPNEIKNSFKDKNGNYDFSDFDYKAIRKIVSDSLTLSQFKEYSIILPILSKILKQQDFELGDNVESFSTKIVKLPDEIKNSIKSESGNFNFDNFDYKKFKKIINYKITPSEFKEYSIILPILREKAKQ